MEDESRGKGSITTQSVAQEKVVGLYGIRSKEKTTDGDGSEMVGSLKNGWSGMAAFGSTIADEEAGDVVRDEMLVEVNEQMTKALVGEAALA